MNLSDKSKENIEKITGLSIEVIRRISPLPFGFYIQNSDKITIGSPGEEVYFKIKNRKLRGDINKVLLRNRENRADYFSEEEIEEYLHRIDYKGLPIDATPRIDCLPIKSLKEIGRTY